MGIKLQANPTDYQKQVLSQWMGCARFIWNAKCEENLYYTRFACKYFPLKTYAPVDQQYAQFKNKELSPWLYEVPSQILRNSASNWYDTYRKFIKGVCGKPRKKKKSDMASVHLTRELFHFEKHQDGVTRLRLGTVKHNLGYLKLNNHRKYKEPNSIYIKKAHGKYWVSFCYEDNVEILTEREQLLSLKTYDREYLNKHVVGIDRGVKIPVQCGSQVFDFTASQKRHKSQSEIKLKRYQRRMARQQLGSFRRNITKRKIYSCYQKIANIREDFCHKTSHSIVSNPDHQVIILEDLKTKNLTKKPKAKLNDKGKWEKNGAKAKAGLNKAILDKGWYKLENYLKYKALRAGKVCFKVSAQFTSQECANCSHIHPNNRLTQSVFKCESCGYSDNADANAAKVIKQRAIELILHPGTGLSKGGVLLLDNGRGAAHKPELVKAKSARSVEASKKMGKRAINIICRSQVPEATLF